MNQLPASGKHCFQSLSQCRGQMYRQRQRQFLPIRQEPYNNGHQRRNVFLMCLLFEKFHDSNVKNASKLTNKRGVFFIFSNLRNHVHDNI